MAASRPECLNVKNCFYYHCWPPTEYLIIEMMSDNCFDECGGVNAQGWSQDEGENIQQKKKKKKMEDHILLISQGEMQFYAVFNYQQLKL